MHDDVVDNAHYRRGFFSIYALWKNKIAVLVGDFLLSKGLLLSLKNDDFELLRIVSNAVQQMSEGELLQMEKARKLDITENLYYEVIKQKISQNKELDEEYLTITNTEKTIEGKLLDELKIVRMCCRRHMLTHVDIE